jgi:putative CocE/NonD family hydrolase
MSDGIVLYADHYYPASNGPHPSLLMRQPDGRDIASTVVYAHPIWFARHGYHVVIQDVRGRGDSEGDFYPFRNERKDGAETIEWLRTHPASNGRIGMYGFSYQGLTQLLAAAEQPKGLDCIAPAMAATDLYHGWFYHQGALRLSSTLGWGIQMLRGDALRRGLDAASKTVEAAWNSIRTQSAIAPYSKHPVLDESGLPTYLADWIAHSEQGDFWSTLDVSTSLDAIHVPALHISGWYDLYLTGTIDGYRALRKEAATAHARDHQYLLAGPWLHIPWGDRIGEADCGPEALLDTDTVLLRWFNHWLKGTGEFDTEPRVRHFALGANRWFSAADIPETARAKHTVFYLHSGGRANSRKGDGLLSLSQPLDEPCDVFVYDPEVPVAAPGGPDALSGGYNQAFIELGNNLLVYTTEPLSAPLHILGEVVLTLYAQTSSAFADFTAKLVRVLPDGVSQFVAIGIARSTWAFPEGYSADAVQCWRFSIAPTSCVFDAGDRVLLEIASSAFPLYDRNPSTAIPPRLAGPGSWARSTQIVHHSCVYPSSIQVPLAGEPS